MSNTLKSRIYALFDDGTADEIIFQYFGAPLSQDIPIRAFSNNIQDLDVQQSVLDGAAAALANYEKHYKSIGDRYCFAYKFSRDSTNQAITGKSAGLAFCLKFALKLYKSVINKELDFSIAATGVVNTDEDQNPVKAVEKINKKLEGVLSCLESGDVFIYPNENEEEVDQKLKTKIIQKGISVIAVENVEQAIDSVLGNYESDKSMGQTSLFRAKYKWIWTFVIISILAISSYFIFSNGSKISCYKKVINELESGNYVEAREIGESCLKKSHNDSLENLLEKLKRRLNIAAEFIYIKNSIENGLSGSNNSPLLLGLNDGYRFEIASMENCYLYIFQFDSGIASEKLFPLSTFILNQHYIPKDVDMSIPGGENMFYLNDQNHHGTITVFIIGSYWRLKDIENIYTKYEDSEVRETKRKFRDDLITRLNRYSDLKEAEFNCLFLKELAFIQQ